MVSKESVVGLSARFGASLPSHADQSLRFPGVFTDPLNSCTTSSSKDHEIVEREEESVDWKGRKVDQEDNHGGRNGIKAATIVCVVEVLENMVFLSNATNFVTYFRSSMHYPSAEAANMVTNFMATSFLLSVLGGFISDSFFTRFKTFLISGSIELLGLLILTIQANIPRFQPPSGEKPSHSQAVVLFIGLYAMATGIGGIKATLPAHGADQLNHSNKKLVSSFFNWFFFSLCTGSLIASTIMVWVEENKGWKWSFIISAVALTLAILVFSIGFTFYMFKLPSGSPFSRIFKVLMSAIRNRKALEPQLLDGNKSYIKYRFLNKAMVDETVSYNQVQETKTFLGLLPIFASTIMMNCCLAQLHTFTVQQGVLMNRKLHNNFQIPPPSLAVFPISFVLLSIPLYEHLALKFTNKASFKPLKRIGVGLALASGSMAAAAIVEVKRRNAFMEDNVRLSIFWLAWQYLLLGISDMLTLGGMLEFFYSEAPESMRSMSTALAWCSNSMGYFLSSVIVSVVNSVSRSAGHEWLGGNDLNRGRLDLFYTLLCVLNFLNFLNYLYCAKRY